MLKRSAFIPAFLGLVLVVVFLSAGIWQTRRAHYKDMLQAEINAAAAEAPLHAGAELLDAVHANLHRLEAKGSWVAERTVLLDNKVQDGVVGYEVVTPLRLAEGKFFLLVNRGWVRAPQLRSELPKISTPSGTVTVEGVARVPTHRFIELGTDIVNGPVWQNLTIERYAAWSQLPLQPLMLYQAGGDEDGLLRVVAAPEAVGIGADRHRGYALTWFSLAGLTVVLGGLTWYRNKRKRND